MVIKNIIIKKWMVWAAAPLFILLILNASCSQTATPATSASKATVTQSDIPSISIPDASELIQKNQANPGFVILDVRTAGEFNGGHLAKAINIDYYSPDFKTEVAKLDRNKEYVVYCQTGIRSAAASRIMLDLGFTRIHNLSGGIAQWVNGGNPVVR